MWILVKESLQGSAKLHHLFKGGSIDTSLDSVALLRWTCSLKHHRARHRIDLGERDTIELGDILDERLKLQSVPVRNRGNSILTPLLDKLFFQDHRVRHIVINIWVVRGIGTQEAREQQTVLDRINLCNAQRVCH